MNTFKVLEALKGKFSDAEKQIVFRAVLQNYVILNKFSQSSFIEKLNRISAHSRDIWNPATLALISLGMNPATLGEWQKKPLEPIDPNLRDDAQKKYERILLQTNYQVDLEDALLVSLFIRDYFVINQSWKNVSEKMFFARQQDDIYSDFWKAVFGCLINIVPNYLDLIVQLNKEKSDHNFVELTVGGILCNPKTDDEFVEIFLDILNLSELSISSRALNLLCKSGYENIARRIARELISKSDRYQLDLQKIDDQKINKDQNQLSNIYQRLFIHTVAGDKERVKYFIDHIEEKISQQKKGVERTSIEFNNVVKSSKNLSRNYTKENKIEEETKFIERPISECDECVDLFEIKSQNEIENGLRTVNRIKQGDYREILNKRVEEIKEKLHDTKVVWISDWLPTDLISSLNENEMYKESTDLLAELKSIRRSDPELMLISASNNSKLGDFEQARVDLEIAMAMAPENIKYKKALMNVSIEMGDWDYAYKRGKEIFDIQPDLSNKEKIRIANTCREANHPEIAIDLCKKLIDDGYSEDAIFALLAQINLDQGKFKDALGNIHKSIEITKNNPKVWVLLSQIENKKGNPAKAIEALTVGKRFCPNSSEICMELGRQYFQMGSKSEGVIHLSEALEKQDITYINANECIELLKKNNCNKHIKGLIQIASEHWPKNDILLIMHAENLLEEKSFDKALKLLSKLIKKESPPYKALLIYILARMDTTLSKFPFEVHDGALLDENINCLLAKLQQIEPLNIWTRMLSAEVLSAQGKNQDAFEAYSKILRENLDGDPESISKAQAGFGKVLLRIRKTDNAIAILKEALSNNPNFREIYRLLTDVYIQCGLIDEAYLSAFVYLAEFNNTPEIADWFAEQLKKIGKVEEGISELRKRINNSELEKNLEIVVARMEFEKGDQKKALAVLDSLFENIELGSKVLNFMAGMYVKLGNRSKAINCLTAAIKDEDNPDEIYLEIAGLQRKENNYQESQIQLSNAIANQKDNPYLKLFLAETLAQEGQTGRAIETILPFDKLSEEEFFQNFPINEFIENKQQFLPETWTWLLQNPENMYTYAAKLCFEGGRFSEALEVIENGLNINPQNTRLRLYTAEMARSILQFEKAEKITKFDSLENGRNKNEIASLLCLQAEMCLERQEEITAASILSKAIQLNENTTSRVKLLQARLLKCEGDKINSDLFFEEAKKDLFQQSADPNLDFENTLWEKIFLEYATIWLMEAAEGLDKWIDINDAFNPIRNTKSINPYLLIICIRNMINAKVFTEFSKNLRIKAHIPQVDLCSQEYIEFINKHIPNLIKEFPELEKWNELFNSIILEQNKDLKELIHPDSDLLAKFYAFLYRKHGEVEKMENLCKSFPENNGVRAQAVLFFMNSNIERSISLAKKNVEFEPQNPINYALLAYVEEKSNNRKAALDALEKALLIWPDESEWYAWSAKLNEDLGNHENSVFNLEKAFAIDPNNHTYNVSLGKLYIKNGEYKKAKKVIKTELINYNDFEGLIFSAEVDLLNNSFKEAYRKAQAASCKNPTSPLPFVIFAKIALELNNLEKAEEYAKLAMDISPNDISNSLLMTRIIAKKNGKKNALDFLHSNSMVDINNPEVIVEKARLLEGIYGTERAETFLKQQDKENIHMLKELAMLEMKLGKKEQAETYALKALSINPMLADMNRLLGNLSEEKGNLDQSLKYYSSTIAQPSVIAEDYIKLSELYLQRRESAAALETLMQGIEQYPENFRLYQMAGKIFWDIKDYMNSEEMFRKAARLKPEDEEIQRQLNTLVAMNILHQEKIPVV